MLPLTQNPGSTPSSSLSLTGRTTRSTRGIAPKMYSPSVTPKRKTRTNTKATKASVKPKPKAIRSKLKSAHRENHIIVDETDGGTVVTLQAGLFEIFKRVILMFYQKPGTVLGGRAFKFGTPREDNVTHTTSILVHSDDQLYTMNFYHSQSKLLVNGRNHAQFRYDFTLFIHFIRSQQAVGGIPIDAEVNEILRLHLEATLDDQTPADASLPTGKEVPDTRKDIGAANQSIGNLRLEGANSGSSHDKEVVAATAGHLALEQSNQSKTNQLAIQLPNSKADSNIVLEDRANVIQPESKSYSNAIKSPTAHIPHRRATHQSDSPHIGSHTEDLVVSQLTPEIQTDDGTAEESAAQSRSSAQVITSTNAETLAKLTANQHTVTLPPSNVIEIAANDPNDNHQRAIAIGSPGSKADKPSAKQRNRGNSNKTEEQKPPDAADLRKREASLRKKEEALKQREKRQETLEKDLADAKAQIIIQEARIKDLEASNRLLNQRILAEQGKGFTQQQTPQPTCRCSSYVPQGQQPVHQPLQQQMHQAQLPPSNQQLLHQMEKMEIRMQYNQQISELKQSFMMDRLSNIPNYQPPMFSYPAPQPPQAYASGHLPYWGPSPATTPAISLQQAMGLTVPTGARPMYPSASGYMNPNANRYIPNPQMQSAEKPSPRVRPLHVSPTRPTTASQSGAQKPKPQENVDLTSQGATASKSTYQSSTPMAHQQAASQRDSFLQAAGPTNHETHTNSNPNHPSSLEPTTSKT